MLWATLCIHQCRFQRTSSLHPGSVSATDLFSLCCPVPLAIDDADFMSSLPLGFRLVSVGLSLESRAAEAAGSGSSIAAVSSRIFYPLYFLSVPPHASLVTSFRITYRPMMSSLHFRPTPSHQTGHVLVSASCYAVFQSGVFPSRPF